MKQSQLHVVTHTNNPALGRPNKNDCLGLKSSLGYRVRIFFPLFFKRSADKQKSILVRVPIAMIKRNVSRTAILWLRCLHRCSVSMAVRARTCRKKLMQGSCRCAIYCLLPHGLLSLLSYSTQDHQSKGLGPPQWVGLSDINQDENALHICQQTDLVEVIFQLGFFHLG